MSERNFSPSLNTSFGKKEPFLCNFERDLQRVLDEVSQENGYREAIQTKNFLKKRNMFLGGDYFLPLQSNQASYLLHLEERVREKIKDIPYIVNCEIDSMDHLLFNLNRPLVYQSILQDILDEGKEYAMSKSNSSVLVLVYNENLKDFDSMRLAVISDHIISFLMANNFRVYYNEYKVYTKPVSSPMATKLTCSDSCLHANYSEKLKEIAQCSEFKKECSESGDCLCLDGKNYLELHYKEETYGKDIKDVNLSSINGMAALTWAAYMKHLLQDHIVDLPEYIFHIVLNGQRNAAYKSGLLLEMLDKVKTSQKYFIIQNTHVKSNFELFCDDFMLLEKQEIENAMAHKYGSAIAEDKDWAYRIAILADSAIKFKFLKVNPNMPLKLDIPNSQNIIGKSTGIFLQYNFARLANLFKNFQAKVNEGYYEPLPSLAKIDFKLLKLEEEWNLFSYLLSFPKIVQSILDSIILPCDSKVSFPTNKICMMLSELCHHLSIYYSKIRILGGQQSQLQNVMHARLWLLKGIHQMMDNCFKFLNMQGLDQM